MMKSWLVSPSPSTGNNRRIELPGTDLRITGPVNSVFVYPSQLNIDRLNDAPGRTLSLWPLVVGRFLLLEGEHYVIEMSDNGIPVSFIENTELSTWPLDENVVRDASEGRIAAFLDPVQSPKVIDNFRDEPLCRLKVTHLVQSNESILGTSWSHILGDADACVNFLHTLSRFYQQLEPLEPLPIFERRLWRKEDADQSLLPMMTNLINNVSAEERREISKIEQVTHDHLNIHFSGEQIATLRKLVPDSTLTTNDVMIAYIIVTLNIHCFSNDEQLILHTDIISNYRGVSDSIAPNNLVANCFMRVVSDNFEDPYSLLNIAKAIRRSIIHARNPKFVESWQATVDGFFRVMARDNRVPSAWSYLPNGVGVNSQFRYDWASLVDFGHTDKCRFYTDGTTNLFLRVYRLNPMYNGTQWIGRDRKGVEVAFRIEKSIKQKFVHAFQQDLKENFINVKI